jgi:hypothetical protein
LTRWKRVRSGDRFFLPSEHPSSQSPNTSTSSMKPLPLIAASFLCAVVPGQSATVPNSTIVLKNPVKKDPVLKSIGPLSFGGGGVLLIAEPGAPAIVAVETGDTGAPAKLARPVEDVPSVIATALKTTADQIQIVDMAVNPASGKIYLSVRNNAAKAVAVIVVDAAGATRVLDLAALPHVRVALPKSEAGPIRTISDLAVAGNRLLVTGQSNEEFSSKIFSIPLPLGAESTGKIFSAETYHISHKKWETKAPIQSFVPYDDHGKLCIVGAFACTPIAKFPLDDIASGANIRGTSVVELGSGNRPVDMFVYGKDGHSWVVTNTNRFHQPLFGPSKYWGVRVSTAYLDRQEPELINEKAARRDVKQTSGPEGIEIMDSLSGAVHISKLDDSTMVVLRESGDKLRLEVASLP